jgi:hypothetical protein
MQTPPEAKVSYINVIRQNITTSKNLNLYNMKGNRGFKALYYRAAS